MTEPIWRWVDFNAFILAMLALDLGVSPREAGPSWKRIMILLRKRLVAVLGGALLIVGVAMLFLPAPASMVIPAALAILAVEFLWARYWLNWLRERYKTISSMKPASNCRLNPEVT